MIDVKSTYKSEDTEEYIDKIFYRPVGYILAIIAKSFRITPNAITISSIFVGVAAGHLFFYRDLSLNLYGIFLLMFAQALDGADGQLARMTNSQSQIGRILDGLSDNLKFISIYIHLILRFVDGENTPLVIAIALIAGVSHSLQSAMADYARNHYVFYVLDRTKSEIEDSNLLIEKYRGLSWSNNFIRKLLMRTYVNYTIEQEFLAPRMKELLIHTRDKFDNNIPSEFIKTYRLLHQPLIKWYNVLTSNTRMIVLFIGLIIGYPAIFWIFELTVLNVLLVYVIIKHNRAVDYLTGKINETENYSINDFMKS